MGRVLGVVEGFPSGPAALGRQPWLTLRGDAPPVAMNIDREALARASRALTKLRSEHRADLERLVEEPERWLAAIADRLERLKLPVHEGRPPEPPALRAVRPSEPHAARLPGPSAALADAVTWALGLDAEVAAAGLAFVARHASALAPRSLLEVVRLAKLAARDAPAAEVWLAALPRARSPRAGPLHHHLGALLGAARPTAPLRPLPAAPSLFDPLAEALATRPLDDLVRAAPLLAALSPWLDLASAAWAEVTALERALAERIALAGHATRALEQRARALAERRPFPVVAEVAAALVRLAAEPSLTAALAAALRALARFPVPVHGHHVAHWARLLEVMPRARVEVALDALAAHVAAGRSLAPWATLAERDALYFTPECALVHGDLAARDYPRFLEVVAVAPAEGLTPSTYAALTAVDPIRAVARARALAALGPDFPWIAPEPAALAHRLAEDDAHAFAVLARRITLSDVAALGAAVRHLERAGVARLGLLALVRDDLGRARALGRALELARRLRASVAVEPSTSPASSPPTADLDPRAALAAELAWLVAHRGPPARVAALERRLATPPTPSPAAQRRAAQREARASAIRAADRALVAARSAVARGLAELFGGASPDWAERELPLVGALLDLASPFRELGLELLRRRAGPAPWDLRDHPKAQALLAAVRPHVRDLDLWLDGTAWPLPHGRVAALDPDPLAVLHMGEPFGTCLAPGGSNFFSAVVNAAEVDKRVLFVRDARGATLARCLLALTPQGGLVAHRVYETASDLDGVVSELVKDLCDRVGLVPLPRADVRPLIAPAWYDDGPVPLAPGEAERALQRALVAAPFDLAAVTALFPGTPEPLWLAAVLATPECQRPEVLRALRPRLLAADLAATDRLLAARALLGCDDRDGAERVLRPAVLDLAARRLEDHGWDDVLVEVGLATHPAPLLRRLRENRRRHLLCDATADYWIGRCLEALGRPRQALAAWASLDPRWHPDLAERRARAAAGR